MKHRMLSQLCVCLPAISVLCASVALANLVQNGGFELTNNAFVGGPTNIYGDKMFFATASPTNWSNAAGSGSNYTYLCSPGTADTLTIASGANPFPVYGPFPMSSGPNSQGGNFVQQDADTSYNSPISQVLSVPSAGIYVLSFRVAGGQQNHPNYTSPTTDRWKVTLQGSSSLVSQLSHNFSLPGPLGAGGTAANVGQWQTETMTFVVPSAGSYLLSFVGNGTPFGQPPVSFLDDVSMVILPEPTSLALIGCGLLGSMAFGRMRRAKPSA